MKDDLDAYKHVPKRPSKRGQQSSLTCSEHSVFGKFDSFCTRLVDIIALYEMIERNRDIFNGRLQGLLQDEEGRLVL